MNKVAISTLVLMLALLDESEATTSRKTIDSIINDLQPSKSDFTKKEALHRLFEIVSTHNEDAIRPLAGPMAPLLVPLLEHHDPRIRQKSATILTITSSIIPMAVYKSYIADSLIKVFKRSNNHETQKLVLTLLSEFATSDVKVCNSLIDKGLIELIVQLANKRKERYISETIILFIRNILHTHKKAIDSKKLQSLVPVLKEFLERPDMMVECEHVVQAVDLLIKHPSMGQFFDEQLATQLVSSLFATKSRTEQNLLMRVLTSLVAHLSDHRDREKFIANKMLPELKNTLLTANTDHLDVTFQNALLMLDGLIYSNCYYAEFIATDSKLIHKFLTIIRTWERTFDERRFGSLYTVEAALIAQVSGAMSNKCSTPINADLAELNKLISSTDGKLKYSAQVSKKHSKYFTSLNGANMPSSISKLFKLV